MKEKHQSKSQSLPDIFAATAIFCILKTRSLHLEEDKPTIEEWIELYDEVCNNCSQNGLNR